MNTSPPDAFDDPSQQPADPGLLQEFWLFLRQNKKWWLLPVLIVLLLFGLLIFLSGTPAAPFIYSVY